MYIHQICITESGDIPRNLPQEIQDNINSFIQVHPGADHILWSHNAILKLFSENFPRSILTAYNGILPFTYKADLARFCILFLYGGVYADLGMLFQRALSPPPHVGLATFRTISFLTESWTTMGTGIIYSRPRRPELEITINRIVENHANRDYGFSIFCPTGPIPFGQAVAKVSADRFFGGLPIDQWIGEVRKIPDVRENQYVNPNNEVVAINAKRGRSLGEIGIEGTNSNFVWAWENRKVYAD